MPIANCRLGGARLEGDAVNQSNQTDLDARYRTILILWFALLMNIGVFFAFSLRLGQGVGDAAPNALLTAVFTAVGILLVVLSFPV